MAKKKNSISLLVSPDGQLAIDGIINLVFLWNQNSAIPSPSRPTSPYFRLIHFVCVSVRTQRTRRVERIDGKFGGPKKRIHRDWSTAPGSRIKNVRKRRAVPPAKQVSKELCKFLCEWALCSRSPPPPPHPPRAYFHNPVGFAGVGVDR